MILRLIKLSEKLEEPPREICWYSVICPVSPQTLHVIDREEETLFLVSKTLNNMGSISMLMNRQRGRNCI